MQRAQSTDSSTRFVESSPVSLLWLMLFATAVVGVVMYSPLEYEAAILFWLVLINANISGY